jgi:hypothetical protein
LRPSALPRALLKKAALPLLLAIGIASPDAHASITGPVPVTLNSAPGNITNTGTNLSFTGFDSAFKSNNNINPNAILTDVVFATSGTTGGTVTSRNQSTTTDSAYVLSGGIFTLALPASGDSVGFTNNITVSGTNSLPKAVFPATQGTAKNATITGSNKSASFSIFSGGDSIFTAANTIALSFKSSFAPVYSSVGPIVTVDNSRFTVSPTLANTTLTYYFSTPEVPGPLPLVGGMTAFAFSRRLRRRITSTAS